MNRRLTLKSETLAELSSAELGAVAGGARTLLDCLTGMYPSINMPCGNTHQVCIDYDLGTYDCPTVHCTGTTSV